MAERGKLGGIETRKVTEATQQRRILEYNDNPSYCKQCNNAMEYKKRKNKFCDSSCAATFTNTRRKRKHYGNCPQCNKILPRENKFCSTTCQHEKQYHDRISDYKSGKVDKLGKGPLRRFLTERDGYKCKICDIFDWCGKPLVLETEHIDGNSDNNGEDNLCLICSNCHSQTPTFKGRNRGKGRYKRRQRYKEGKSY